MKLLLSCLSFAAVLLSCELHAQKIVEITEPIVQKMEWYGVKKNPPVLFVHFDKNVYVSNEPVWFTAYLLETKQNPDEHHTLVVSLIRNDDSVVLQNEKFLMDKSLSFGRLVLPDSLAPGHYSFLVYTNILADGKPAASFLQPITIKSETEPGFTVSLKLAEEINAGSDSLKLSFKASSKEIHTLIPNADISYTLGSGNYRLKGKLKTDVYGGVDFKVPVKQLNAGNNRLRLQASFKKETKSLQLVLPVADNKAIVKFFPEGGTLREGNRTVIGWEVRDAHGEPLLISGILYKNERVIDTIQTNAYGIGRFTITTEPGNSYYVSLVKSDQEKIRYALPEAIAPGLSIYVADAVCHDTLVLRVQDKTAGMFYAMVHDYTSYFLSFPLDMTVTNARTFRIPLTDVPKGIKTLTILDSSGRPVAERMFFTHYDVRTELEIKTGQAEYQTRKKVTLSLQLKDVFGKPVEGRVSVACVQNNRIDPRKMTDIEGYLYLNNELSMVPFKKDPMGMEKDNRGYWEDILLIKGWRRYTWPDLLLTKAEDTIQKIQSLLVTGSLTRNEKPVTRPFPLTVVTGSAIQMITTDSTGHFGLDNENLVLEPDKKLLLYLVDKNKEDYYIYVADPYNDLSHKLGSQVVYEDFDAGVMEKNSDAMVLKQGEKAIVLKEVIVTANKKGQFNEGRFTAMQKRNACGDYVCVNNVLNCPNHASQSSPIAGHIYRYVMGARVTTKVYAGCLETKAENKFAVFLKGTYRAKEFYNADYSTVNDSEQMYLSTIFWDYSVAVNSTGPTELSFYTSDIAGKFKIVAQGISTTGVVHGEYVFNVVK